MSLKAALLLSTAAVLALSGSAMAADLAMPAPAAAPPMAAPAPGAWDGPYIGASVGYGWGTATDSYTGESTGTESANLSGALVGVQAGYNFHLSDNLVGGLEGNIDWLNETGSYGGETQTINWEGSIRARLGVDAGQFMPYVEAGVAFANSTYATSSSSVSNNHTGWTVGAGVEFMLADHLSANVEYRYSDYGTQTYTTSSYTNKVHLTDSTVRLGLNYHF